MKALMPVIAVDGPAASGKGTVAQAAAGILGFHYLDSGSLYRLVAFKAMRSGAMPPTEAQLVAIATALDVRFEGDRIELEGVDVTDAIRTEEVGAAASQVAVYPPLRRALLSRQRAFREPPGLVAEGRDMGTVVFPDAAPKIFITASAEERARRRYKQLIDKGKPVILEGLLRDILERDARDGARAVAPLKPAPDAFILDTTGMSIEDAVDFLVKRYRALAAPTPGNVGAGE